MSTTTIMPADEDGMALKAIPSLLRVLHLPGIFNVWESFYQRALVEGWSHGKFLHALLEHEVCQRDARRIQRRITESKLPKGKTLATFDFNFIGSVRKRHIEALATGRQWVEQAENLLIFGPSGSGKTHLVAAIAYGIIHHGYRVLYSSTTKMSQNLQKAKKEWVLPAALAKLDRFDCIILDDIAYVNKDQDETSVLFELISERYEQRSLIITSNKPFGEWENVFPDKAMAVAAIDRLVHHSTVIELKNQSYRKWSAEQKRKEQKENEQDEA